MKKFIYILFFIFELAVANAAANVHNPSSASKFKVSGIVVSERNEPLPGAFITVEGTNIGMGTNANGEFEISLGRNRTYKLFVNYMGYKQKELSVSETDLNKNLRISLIPAETALNEVVVTGTRNERPLKDVPVITRVISNEDIKTINPVDLPSLLEYTLPGIQFYYNTMSQVSEITYQGMDAKAVLFLLDGERISGESGANNIDYSRFNIDDIERVEVVRGAAATLYDSRAIGGVINIITKKSVRPFDGNINSRYAGRNGQSVSVSGGVNLKKFSSLTSVGYRGRGTYTIKDEKGKIKETINPDGTVTKEELPPEKVNIYGYAICDVSQKFSFKFNERLSADLRASYYINKRDTYSGKRFHQTYEDLILSGRVKYQITRKQNLDFSYTRDNYVKNNVFNLIKGKEEIYKNKNNTVRLYYSGTFGKHTLSGGVDFIQENLKHHFMRDTAERRMIQFSGCLQEDWRITDDLNVVVGVRGDKGGNYKFHLTPKISVLYRPWKRLTFRAGYSHGYRIPNLKELYQEFNMGGVIMMYGNKNLKPEEGNQLSCSAEYDHKGLNIAVSGYHNNYKNKIDYDYINPGKSMDMQYVNKYNVKTTGVEITTNYKFPFGLGLSGAYTYIHDYNVKDGYNLSWLRPHSARFSAMYKFRIGKSHESIGLNCQWVSAMTRYSFDGKTKSYTRYNFDQRTLCSVNLRSEPIRGIHLGFMIDNIFNYKDKAADSAVQLPQNGITFVFTIGINISDLLKL